MFGLLALAANGLTLAILVTTAAGPSWRRGDQLLSWIRGSALPLAWLIATVATLGSLYLSEIAHLPPCTLCWYQRIAMYPLPVILGIAWFRGDPQVRRYVVPVALIGGAIASYHYLIEWSPALSSGACTTEVPCDVAWFRIAGFMSIPYMALSAFAAIVALMALLSVTDRSDAQPDPRTSDVHEDRPTPERVPS